MKRIHRSCDPISRTRPSLFFRMSLTCYDISIFQVSGMKINLQRNKKKIRYTALYKTKGFYSSEFKDDSI